ncbi:MAG: beta-lactamase family protein [Dehalococcoidales bacterium]|nr:MAG: beta-lactamase family protein [Dehalococcoidales bacterium]
MSDISKYRLILMAVLVPMTAVVSGLYWGSWWKEASAQTDGTLQSDISSFISERMAVENIPGVAVVVVQDAKVIYLEGFGTASLKDPSPVTPQTVFDLASCSKSFTALAVLLLRDDGLVDLDLPVSHYLPDFKTADPETAEEITVRYLLHHTSGLPGTFAEPLAFHSGDDAMDKLVASLDRVHLNRAPGLLFEYSNLNYSLLGAVIDEVSGVSFEEYLEQRVFVPLGMMRTTMIPSEADVMDRADGHQLLFGHVVTRNIPVYRSVVPAGWVMSTAEDMGKWLIVQLSGGRIDGRQVVPSETIMELHTPGVSYEQKGEEVGYGMGWFIGLSDADLSLVWHGGDTSNFAADMVMVPEHQLGVAVLVNSQNSSRVHSLAPDVASLILGQELVLPTAPWWGSWRSADTMAIAAAATSVAAFIALVVYFWWRWRRFRLWRTAYLRTMRRRTLRIWRMALPLTPLVLLATAVTAIWVVVWLLFGFNLFRVLMRFGSFAPPGVWIAGWMTFGVISIWALALAGQTLFRYWIRHRVRRLRSQS